MNPFGRLWSSPHTRIAAIVYVLSKLGIEIAEVWFGQYDQKLKSTATLLESFAVGYGFLMAGDSSQGKVEVLQKQVQANKTAIDVTAKSVEAGDTDHVRRDISNAQAQLPK